MNRRLFITSVAALMSAPKLLLAGQGTAEYTPGLIATKLAAGETVFVDYAAAWCSTCKRQERIVDELRANNPEFDKNISFVTVDWDKYGSSDVARSRNIPRRSTLILLKGDEELGRIVAGTNSDAIKALLELGITNS